MTLIRSLTSCARGRSLVFVAASCRPRHRSAQGARRRRGVHARLALTVIEWLERTPDARESIGVRAARSVPPAPDTGAALRLRASSTCSRFRQAAVRPLRHPGVGRRLPTPSTERPACRGAATRSSSRPGASGRAGQGGRRAANNTDEARRAAATPRPRHHGASCTAVGGAAPDIAGYYAPFTPGPGEQPSAC
jgi:hypothetical protein